jgi:hypothetical protein
VLFHLLGIRYFLGLRRWIRKIEAIPTDIHFLQGPWGCCASDAYTHGNPLEGSFSSAFRECSPA